MKDIRQYRRQQNREQQKKIEEEKAAKQTAQTDPNEARIRKERKEQRLLDSSLPPLSFTCVL